MIPDKALPRQTDNMINMNRLLLRPVGAIIPSVNLSKSVPTLIMQPAMTGKVIGNQSRNFSLISWESIYK